MRTRVCCCLFAGASHSHSHSPPRMLLCTFCSNSQITHTCFAVKLCKIASVGDVQYAQVLHCILPDPQGIGCVESTDRTVGISE